MDPYNPIIGERMRLHVVERPRWHARVNAVPSALRRALRALALWPALLWAARRVAGERQRERWQRRMREISLPASAPSADGP